MRHKHHHRVEEDQLNQVAYKTLWAWVLENPMRYDPPFRYVPKRGQVIWANI